MQRLRSGQKPGSCLIEEFLVISEPTERAAHMSLSFDLPCDVMVRMTQRADERARRAS